MQRLSNREKREFYTGLARLVRSGSSLPGALDLLARDTPRRVSRFLKALNKRINAGEPIGEALLKLRPGVSDLEASIVTASSKAGRLDHGCDQLARYFDALVQARAELIKRMLYPFFVLNFGPIAINLGVLLKSGLIPFLWAVSAPLLSFYAIAAVLWLAWQTLDSAARSNVLADALLAVIPGIGSIRQKFALARFFATLEAQLEASVNIWDAFANAAKTSDSARIISAARRAMPALQSGDRLSEVLSREKIVPSDYVRSFRVAEQAGEMDAELTQMAAESEKMAVAALNRWSIGLAGAMYGAVMLYTAFQIVQMYRAQFSQVSNFDPFQQ